MFGVMKLNFSFVWAHAGLCSQVSSNTVRTARVQHRWQQEVTTCDVVCLCVFANCDRNVFGLLHASGVLQSFPRVVGPTHPHRHLIVLIRSTFCILGRCSVAKVSPRAVRPQCRRTVDCCDSRVGPFCCALSCLPSSCPLARVAV